jgi:HD-GYP domain-containing protein (c-di-GMP phosphodiesterase class II)
LSDLRTPHGAEWEEVLEALRRFSSVLTSRAQYPDGHPAVRDAVTSATDGFRLAQVTVPEIVVAILDGEYVVCERPMPDLRGTRSALASAMERHGVECIVFLRGLEEEECEHLGRVLMLPADQPGRVRATAQAGLAHIHLRFAEVRAHDTTPGEVAPAVALVPRVEEVHAHILDAFAHEELADLRHIRELARTIVASCTRSSFTLLTRCYVEGASDQAAHATNVAMMTAALAYAARVGAEHVVEITAAALLHDIGTFLTRSTIRGLPAPLLPEQDLAAFRSHPLAGAWALLTTGCPPLWVAVALQHHRGIDGGGYPQAPGERPPHELVRTVALVNFFDRKRTLLAGQIADPEEVIRQAGELEPVYFGAPLVQRFLRTFGVYPPGTTVELTDRQVAVVTQPSSRDPLRPQVELLTGPEAGTQVDLGHRNTAEERHDLSIARAILPPLALRAEGLEPLPEPPPELEPEAPLAPEPAQPEPPPEPEPESPPEPARDPETDEDDDQILARLGGADAVPTLAVGQAELRQASLDHREAFLLTFIDGMSPLDALLYATGLPRSEVLRIIDRLVRAGFVRIA